MAALMIVLNFFVLGFMGSYLLTRLFLQEAFRTVEESRASLAVTRSRYRIFSHTHCITSGPLDKMPREWCAAK